MSRINRRYGTFERTAAAWVGAVGANVATVDVLTGLCARALIVATVGAGGTLAVLEAGGNARVYTAADINAAQGFLRGNFEQLTAVGSVGCFNITIGW